MGMPSDHFRASAMAPEITFNEMVEHAFYHFMLALKTYDLLYEGVEIEIQLKTVLGMCLVQAGHENLRMINNTVDR